MTLSVFPYSKGPVGAPGPLGPVGPSGARVRSISIRVMPISRAFEALLEVHLLPD